MLIDTDHMLTITAASARGVSSLANDAANGHDLVLLRNGRPVAAVVSTERLDRMQRLEELDNDIHLLAIALSRVVLDDGTRVTLDDVLDGLGLTRDDLVTPVD